MFPFIKVLQRSFPIYKIFIKTVECNYLKPLSVVNLVVLYNKCKIDITHNLLLKNKYKTNILLCSGFLTWLGFNTEDKESESQLIITIKRSILLMQRGELEKAEQMLHLALRLAQNQSNSQGIIYIYDLMANLALEQEQVEKAEKLFINVLQKLLIDGITQDDIKVIHISLKLARISHMKGELEKAEIGFLWCLEMIQKHLENSNKDILALNGVIQDWYANYLIDKGMFAESLKYLEEAYKINLEIDGSNNEKSVLLLNDLGTVNWHSGNFDSAYKYFIHATTLGEKIENFDYIGVIYANLGLVRLKQGMLSEAQKYCKEGWRLGHKQNNSEAIKQANYCFEQIKMHF